MRTKLFLISTFCFLLSASSYAQTITTAGVAWKGTNGANVFSINPTGSVTSPFFIGDGSQLTGIVGGSGTFDYATLTNKPAPILLLATNQGSSLSNAFAIAAGDSSVTLVTNANGRLVTITSTGGGTNGGGAAVVSNSVVTWTTGTWFTNSTAYYLVVNAPVILTTDNTGANSGQMNFNVDTNLNGVTDWFLRSSIAVDSATTVLSTDIRYLGGIVPPNSAFQYQDVSINGTATMDGVMELTFLSTGSSGSGSGTFDYALLTNKPAPILLVATNQGSSLTNTVDLIAGDSSVVIVTNANKRSFTLTSTGGSGIATNGGTGINNRFTNTVFAGTIGFSNDVTIAGNISVAGTFGVNTAYVTNLIVITTNDLPQTQSFSYFEDFLGAQLGTTVPGYGELGLYKAVAGTGAVGANGVPTTNAPGIQTLNVGTVVSGSAFMYNFGAGADNAMYSLRGTWTNEWRVRLSGTNNVSSTNNYHFQAGFSDAPGSFTTVDGAYAYYGTNSPYVGLVTANNSTRTTNYSTFVPDANTWFKVRVVVTANSTLTNAVLTINGANNVTNTSNIPTGGTRNVALQAGMLKMDGTDARLFDTDYVYLGYTLETPR